MKKTTRPKDVNSYIAVAPKEVRGKLKEMRKAIKEVAPATMECLIMDTKECWLISLLQKNISGFIYPPVIAEHKKGLKDYETAKATIRFPLNKKLPIALIKKLIKVQMKKNEKNDRF